METFYKEEVIRAIAYADIPKKWIVQRSFERVTFGQPLGLKGDELRDEIVASADILADFLRGKLDQYDPHLPLSLRDFDYLEYVLHHYLHGVLSCMPCEHHRNGMSHDIEVRLTILVAIRAERAKLEELHLQT